MTEQDKIKNRISVERLTKRRDLAAIAILEEHVFDDPWSIRSIGEYAASQTGYVLGAKVEEKIVGYAILQIIPEETEILRIAVDADCRREGVASNIMKKIRNLCKEQGGQRILLEVRSRNQSAVRFYEKEDFSVDCLRKGYYLDPPDDALLMSFSFAQGKGGREEENETISES